MSRNIGRHPKFHILCKRCNSYRFTQIDGGQRILCTKCGNRADSFDEKFEDEEA